MTETCNACAELVKQLEMLAGWLPLKADLLWEFVAVAPPALGSSMLHL